MLEELDELKDIEGKTVKSVVDDSERALISFTDGAFIEVQARWCYDDAVLHSGEFNQRYWGDDDLAKIFGQEQVDLWNKQYDADTARWEAEAKEQRRKQYEQLRAEFGE